MYEDLLTAVVAHGLVGDAFELIRDIEFQVFHHATLPQQCGMNGRVGGDWSCVEDEEALLGKTLDTSVTRRAQTWLC